MFLIGYTSYSEFCSAGTEKVLKLMIIVIYIANNHTLYFLNSSDRVGQPQTFEKPTES